MENNQLTKEKASKPLGEWANFGIGYLTISEIACDEMIKSMVDGKIEKDFLYIPIIYNIKHAIEIFEKLAILVTNNKDYLERQDWGHDIKKLFTKLKNEIDFEGIAEYYAKDKNQYLTMDSALITKRSDAFSNLVDKYHHLSFLIEKIGADFLIEDSMNDAFRYPQNHLLIKPEYKKILEKITIEDIRQIKKDIIEFKNFIDIGTAIGVYYMKTKKGKV